MFAPNTAESVDNTIKTIVKNKEKALFESTYQGDYSNGEGFGTHVIYDTTKRLSPTDKLVRFIS